MEIYSSYNWFVNWVHYMSMVGGGGWIGDVNGNLSGEGLY